MSVLRAFFFLLFSFTLVTISHSQEVKKVKNDSKKVIKTLYLDEDNIEISKKEFKKRIDYRVNLDYTITTDSQIIHKLFRRQRFGKIEANELAVVQSGIENSLGTDIDFSQNIAFGYFPEMSKCYKEYSGHLFYLNEPRFNKYNIPYYAVLSPKAKVDKYLFPFHVDKSELFEQIFAEELACCEIWMLLKPNGQFRVYLGEGGPFIFSEIVAWDDKYIKKAMKRL